MSNQRMVPVEQLKEMERDLRTHTDAICSAVGRSILDDLRAIIDGPGVEPVAWVSTTLAFTRYVTQSRYDSFSPEIKGWYKPYRCSVCTAPSTPAQAVPDGWQPIETAPRDGTRVMLHRNVWSEDVCIGFWNNNFDEWRIVGSGSPWVGPTHWMPIPQPPVKEN